MLFSAEEIRNGDLATQLFKKIRERYVQRVKAQGPSVVSLEAEQSRFLEIMMDLCEGGEFQMVRKKLSKAISHFAKVHQENRSNIFSGSTHGVMKNDDFGQDVPYNTSIEEPSTLFTPNQTTEAVYQQPRVPKIILAPMHPVPPPQKQSPRITDYLDYLSGNQDDKQSPRS